MDTTNPTNETKSLTLEEAKARIEEERERAQASYDQGKDRYYQGLADGFDQSDTFLARVEMPSQEWQPIETAPKDEEVMVIHKDYGVIQATCYSSMLESAAEECHDFPWSSPADEEEWIYTNDLTHWMPMLDLPK